MTVETIPTQPGKPVPKPFPNQANQNQPNLYPDPATSAPPPPNVPTQSLYPTTNESNVLKIKPSFIALFPYWLKRAYSIGCCALAALLVVAVVGFILYLLGTSVWIIQPKTILIIAIVAFIIAALYSIVAYLNSYYQIEPGLVIRQIGFTQRREQIVAIVKAELKQTFFTKLLGLGHIYVSFQGSESEVYVSPKTSSLERAATDPTTGFDIVAFKFVPKAGQRINEITRILSMKPRESVQPPQGGQEPVDTVKQQMSSGQRTI